jgi:hypothetical protein
MLSMMPLVLKGTCGAGGNVVQYLSQCCFCIRDESSDWKFQLVVVVLFILKKDTMTQPSKG